MQAPRSPQSFPPSPAQCFVQFPASVTPITAPASIEYGLRTTATDVLITRELFRRSLRPRPQDEELTQLRWIAGEMNGTIAAVLQRLVVAALRLCDAGSAGLCVVTSAAEPRAHLRWRIVAGELEYERGRYVPRHLSPCGFVLESGSPQLFSHPARHFQAVRGLRPRVVEMLSIPVYAADLPPYATLWVAAHDSRRRFDAGDVRVLNSLTAFVGAVVSARATGVSRTERSPKRRLVWPALTPNRARALTLAARGAA